MKLKVSGTGKSVIYFCKRPCGPNVLTGEFPATKTGIQKVNCGNLASEPLTSTKGRLLIEVPLF
jgi:hypothetical protein